MQVRFACTSSNKWDIAEYLPGDFGLPTKINETTCPGSCGKDDEVSHYDGIICQLDASYSSSFDRFVSR